MSLEQHTALRWETLDFEDIGAELLYRLLKLRQDIFIVEQQCIYCDLDNLDQVARHLCAMRGQAPAAYLRSLPPGTTCEESSLGRVAVSAESRGVNLGRELVQRGIEHNRERWPGSGIRIGAQAHLEGFYADFGFVSVGEPYVEDGIPHIEMIYGETA